MEVARRHASFEDFWELTLDLSRSFHDAVMSQPEPVIAEIRAELEARLAQFATDRRGARGPVAHARRPRRGLNRRPAICAVPALSMPAPARVRIAAATRIRCRA